VSDENVVRGEAGRFLPGQAPKSPGRPPGARSKLSESFLSAMCADFEKHGIATIQLARLADPMGYIKTVAGILPKELTGEDGSAIALRIERVIVDPKN